jgi:hypothetical protein
MSFRKWEGGCGGKPEAGWAGVEWALLMLRFEVRGINLAVRASFWMYFPGNHVLSLSVSAEMPKEEEYR